MWSFGVSFDCLAPDATHAHPKKMLERVTNHTACQFDPFYFNLADLSIFFHMRTNCCVRHWCTGAMCDFDKSLDLANLLFSQVPWLVPFRLGGKNNDALGRIPLFDKAEYTESTTSTATPNATKLANAISKSRV